MTRKTVEIIRRALENARGDDLERATRVFAGKSTAQLDAQYGESGQTCRQIWDTYKKHRSEHDAAVAEFEASV